MEKARVVVVVKIERAGQADEIVRTYVPANEPNESLGTVIERVVSNIGSFYSYE